MTNFARFLAGAAAIGMLAAPAAAQYQYPQQQYQYPQQSYPQQAYPGYPQQGYPQQGYNQGYNQNPIGQIIDQLLGNRYSVTDRQAVGQCASAAMRQAAAQYGGNGYNQGYNQGYAQTQGYGYNRYRVSAITDVQRRSNGLRVSGRLSSGGGYGGNGYNQGYANRGYGAANLSFRCNVDYRGYVTNVRVRPMMYRQGY